MRGIGKNVPSSPPEFLVPIDRLLGGAAMLHPLIVHFPVALLLVAPLFMLVALLLPKRGRGLGLAGLVLLVLGTVALFVTVSTGSAAGELSERNPAVKGVLERHEELGEFTRNLFAGLALVYAALVVLTGKLPCFGLTRRGGGRRRRIKRGGWLLTPAKWPMLD